MSWKEAEREAEREVDEAEEDEEDEAALLAEYRLKLVRLLHNPSHAAFITLGVPHTHVCSVPHAP